MQEIGLRYKGKTFPLRLEQLWLTKKLVFVNNTDVVWVAKNDADRLLQFNLRMFETVGERKIKDTQIIKPVTKVEPEDVDDAEKIPVTFVKDDETPTPEKKKRGAPKGGWPKKNKKEEKIYDYNQK